VSLRLRRWKVTLPPQAHQRGVRVTRRVTGERADQRSRRGVHWADVENKTPVQSDALFRIASVSKPITGVAIMKRFEEGKFALGDRVAPLIAHLFLVALVVRRVSLAVDKSLMLEP
jgi:CubicO group peptidase (beta-lactamase class C family)